VSASAEPAYEPSGGFDVVGVDAEHEAVYRAVVTSGATSVAEIAASFGQSAERARALLESLRERGLIARGGDGDYFAVDPRVAMRALTERTAARLDILRSTIPDFAEMYDTAQRATGGGASLRFVSGGAAVGAWYSRIEQATTSEFLAFDRPPYVLAPVNPVQPLVIARGVEWRAVYAASALEREGAWDEIVRSVGLGEQARIAPDLPVKMAISDRRIAIVASSLDPARPEALVAEAPPIVALLVELFESHWERAADVPAQPDDAVAFGRGRGPTAQELAILALFAAGAKDAVIARELGMSVRTLRRRSALLLRRLGAANRFQAGAQAVRRGWI